MSTYHRFDLRFALNKRIFQFFKMVLEPERRYCQGQRILIDESGAQCQTYAAHPTRMLLPVDKASGLRTDYQVSPQCINVHKSLFSTFF